MHGDGRSASRSEPHSHRGRVIPFVREPVIERRGAPVVRVVEVGMVVPLFATGLIALGGLIKPDRLAEVVDERRAGAGIAELFELGVGQPVRGLRAFEVGDDRGIRDLVLDEAEDVRVREHPPGMDPGIGARVNPRGGQALEDERCRGRTAGTGGKKEGGDQENGSHAGSLSSSARAGDQNSWRAAAHAGQFSNESGEVVVGKCRFDRSFFLCDTSNMSATLEDITQQVLQLPARQRLVLAGFLLEMGDESDHPEVDEAWEKEIQDRIKAVDRGAVTGVSYSDVMREADQRLAP